MTPDSDVIILCRRIMTSESGVIICLHSIKTSADLLKRKRFTHGTLCSKSRSNEQFSFFQGVKNPTAEQIMAKSALDSIVGNLWQQRQESSGSSVGNQVTTRDPKSGTTVIFNNERGD